MTGKTHDAGFLKLNLVCEEHAGVLNFLKLVSVS